MKDPQLGDFYLPDARCSSCGEVLSSKAPVEEHKSQSEGFWIVALCLKCQRWSPFKVEKSA